MSYRKEIEELILELRNFQPPTDLDVSQSLELRDKKLRQAEVLDFLINHTQDAIANLDAE